MLQPGRGNVGVVLKEQRLVRSIAARNAKTPLKPVPGSPKFGCARLRKLWRRDRA
jgi:hypothetical protein